MPKRHRYLLSALLLTASVTAQATPAVLWPSAAPPALSVLGASVMALLTPDEVLDLMEGGQLAEAEAAAQRAVSAHPESARARVVLARILARQDRLDEARRVLDEAKALPQWEEEDLGVPFESPKTIDQTMQRDPARALNLIADVLLAEGNDPKAYYLQSLAYIQLAEYDASQVALNKAREYGDVAAFAHPDTLARLEELLRERPGARADTATVQPIGTPALTAEAERESGGRRQKGGVLSDFVFSLLMFLVGTAVVWAISFVQRLVQGLYRLAKNKAARLREVQQAQERLDSEIEKVQQTLQAGDATPERQRHLERLLNMKQTLVDWSHLNYGPGEITGRFQKLLAAAEDDQRWQACQDELARQTATAAAQSERTGWGGRFSWISEGSGSASSFKGGSSRSWSSGASRGDRGNNGGSKW